MTQALRVRRVCKSYPGQTVLDGVDLELPVAGTALLLGPSGSGKSTLLAILGGLLEPDGGSLELGGNPMPFGCRDSLAGMRRQQLGFVFQHAQLLPFLNVQENLQIVADNAGVPAVEGRDRCRSLLFKLGLGEHAGKLPGQLSGGQRQRVAIARALVHRPRLILADEPTAALDWKHGEQVVELLVDQSRENQAALLVVTHDLRLVPRFQQVFALDQGRIREVRE